jgi:hypothetical protein
MKFLKSLKLKEKKEKLPKEKRLKTKKVSEEKTTEEKIFDPWILKVLGYVRIPFVSLILELLFWKLVDLFRLFKIGKKRKVHLYGIWCFVGLYGGGKTMSLVEYLERKRKRFGSRIYIATNFFYKNQDFPIDSWQDLLKEYDKPVIFGYDELQNEFNSREYEKFPVNLMHMLTQNRKGHGKQIVYTAQDFETVDKNFRRLTTKVVRCKTWFGRLTITKAYDIEDFLQLSQTLSVDRKMRIRPKAKESSTYVQTDYLRNLYDSYQMLEVAKKKQSLGLHELRQVQ